MDQSINRHNSMTMTKGFPDSEGMSGISGGEFSLFAMNRSRQRFIDILTTWQTAKAKKEERKQRDLERDKMVS